MSSASAMLLRSSSATLFARRPVANAFLNVYARSARKTSTTAYQYVPGGPILKGTVNDPTSFPPPSKSHGSYHWAFERLLSASLVPLTITAAVTSGSQYALVDGLLGVALVMHSHIGFDSMVVDYLHPRKFPFLGPFVTWTLRALTTGAVFGIYQFNTNDIGLVELVAKLWHA